MKADWTRVPLGDAFSTVTGSTPSKSDSSLYGDFMPLVKPPELLDGPLDSAEDGLSKTGVQIARTLPAHSVLISCIGNLGKVGLNTIPVAFNQQINAVIPNRSKALPQFIFYQALSEQFRDQLEALATGTTVRIVNKSKFNSILIVLPSLPEQRRIVDILDEAFEGIATAKANAAKNLQNARAIFESQLDTVFCQRGAGWVEQKIVECFKVRSGEFLPAKKMVQTGHFNVYGGNGVNGRHDQHNLSGQNIIIGRVGAKCGNVRCVDGDIWVTDNAFYIAKYLRDFDLEFLALALERKQLRDTANQAAQPVISYATIKDVVIEFPAAVGAQREIREVLTALQSESKKLTNIYERKLATLESLKMSLLHRAFAGELTADKTSELIEAVA